MTNNVPFLFGDGVSFPRGTQTQPYYVFDTSLLYLSHPESPLWFHIFGSNSDHVRDLTLLLFSETGGKTFPSCRVFLWNRKVLRLQH